MLPQDAGMWKVTEFGLSNNGIKAYIFVLPEAGIPGIIAVIAHHKVAAFGDGKRSKVLIDYLIRIVRIKRRAINIYDAVLSLKSLPGKSDNTLQILAGPVIW